MSNQAAHGEQVRARDRVLAAERVRQNAFDQEAEAINAESQQRYVGFEPQQAERAAVLGDVLGADVGAVNADAASAMPTSTSNVVNEERENQMDEAQGFVDQQTGALASLRSFGDLLGETSLMQSRDAGKIAQIGSFKQGSNAIVPLELDKAQEAGEGWRLLGDLLGGAGDVATGAGINGGSKAIHKWANPSFSDSFANRLKVT